MTGPDDPGPEGGRAVAGRLVYDPSFATVSEEEFNELVALMRDGARRKPIGNATQRGILSGHWDQGSVVGAFRDGRGSLIADRA